MKKLIITALMTLLMATTAFAIAIIDEDGNIIQENEILEGGIMTLSGDLGDFDFDFDVLHFPAFGSATGEVVEFWKNATDADVVRIRIPLDGEYESEYTHFDFILDDNTFIQGEHPIMGGKITGFFDNNRPVIMIYPPQHTALVIINRSEDLPFIILERFNEEWISSGHQYRLRINDDTPIYFQGGDRFEGEKEELIGRKLLVQYTISHRDIPMTIPAPEKITILYERAVHPTLEIDRDDNWQHLTADRNPDGYWLMMAINLNWYGQELTDPANYDIIITINDVTRGIRGASPAKVGNTELPNYLPLRAITEALGFEPQWNENSREITVSNPRGKSSFRIGVEYYNMQFEESGITLTYQMDAPVVIEGRTYVPFAFFRDIFGFTNVWFEGGTVSLDNAERME
ncbi:MAG: copper amine oxidase N-terminal domain-containing protein [Defluviitaleaceae bacterium]|nr:copper amine oxidase N-terminal domain-containing protein [Defluviitaleaceae bacterium]